MSEEQVQRNKENQIINEFGGYPRLEYRNNDYNHGFPKTLADYEKEFDESYDKDINFKLKPRIKSGLIFVMISYVL